MGDGKPNIIEKSYKLLFVIYAPIALLGYIINAVGGFQISFITIFLILVTGISVILTIFLVVRYAMLRKRIIVMPDVNKKAPYIFRHDFLIPFIFISIFSFTALSIMTYNGVSINLNENRELIKAHELRQKPKIVLILGLSDINRSSEGVSLQNTLLDYGASEVQGLSFYRRFSNEHGNNFDFELIDHNQIYSKELEEKIKSELSNGVTYFICTTSTISVPLSRKFGQLVAETNTAESNPILMVTNSGSPDVETKANSVYRFYIQSVEESNVLVEKAKQLNLKNIVYIAIDNEYGKSAVNAFEQKWRSNGGFVTDGIFLDPMLSKENIINKIQKSNLLKQNPEAIFIANNNSSLQNTIEGIENFPNDIVVLCTSGLSVKFTQAPVQHILKNKKWYTCVPDSKGVDDIITFDINTSFLYMTIDKLTRAIEEVERNPNTTIHDELTTQDSPRMLNFEYGKNGNFNIDLRIDSTLIGNLNR